MNVLNRDSKFNTSMTYREDVLSKISATIQAKIGIVKPKVLEYSRYEQNKQVIEDEIRRSKHFSESDWKDCQKILLDNLRNLTDNDCNNDDVSSGDEEGYNDRR
jgi:hypothetical protein